MAKAKRICSVDGCGKPHEARGWCKVHYNRWKRHGDPLAGGVKHGEPLRWLEDVALLFEGEECLIWPYGTISAGYGIVTIDGKKHYVHRIACEAEHGPPPTPEHDAAHSCGNGHNGCVNRKHLRWATRAENNSDKLAHGTSYRGERQWRSKLTEAQVLEIRAADGLHREIAARFGVSGASVSLIRSRRSWGWL